MYLFKLLFLISCDAVWNCNGFLSGD